MALSESQEAGQENADWDNPSNGQTYSDKQKPAEATSESQETEQEKPDWDKPSDGQTSSDEQKPVDATPERLRDQALEAEAGESPNNGDARAAGPATPATPPDGGIKAWLQVLGGFMLFFNTWGILNTFGVYQTYYASGAIFQASSSDIGWIGAVQASSLLLTGLIAGPLYDRGHFRALLVVGSFLIVFGHMMLSLSTQLWQIVLSQGLCIGIGAGSLFLPAVAILPTYFRKRLGTAIGLAASGSSLGGIVYPIMFYKIIGEVGFPWGVRILGFTALALLAVPVMFMQMRYKPPKARAVWDMTALTDAPFLMLCFSLIVGFIGFYGGLFYISYYGEASGITDASLSFYLIPILNAGSCFGRTVPNYISDKTGALNMLIPGSLICGILMFCLLAVNSVAGIVIIALLFGFFSGVFIALPAVVVVTLTKDKTKIGTRIGMAFAFVVAGALTGGPGTGAIIGTDPKNLDWRGTWIWCGAWFLGCGALFTLLRIWVAGPRLMVKA